MVKRWVGWAVIFVALAMLAMPVYAVDVREVKSPGGLAAWLAPVHDLPIVAVTLSFREAGASSDPAGKEGRASLVASLLDEGAGDLDALAFQRAVEDHAISFAAQAGRDDLQISMKILSSEKEAAFALLGSMLTQPRFDADAVERMRSALLAGLRQRESSPEYIAAVRWDASAFAGHPYGSPVRGTAAGMAAITREELAPFAQHYFTRQNLVIGVAGDITEAEVAALLDKYLLKLPGGFAPDSTVADTQMTSPGEGKAPKALLVRREQPQTTVAFGLPGVARNDPDFYAYFVLNHILGGGSLTSRMIRDIRIDKGLTYSVSTSINPMRHAATLEGMMASRNDKAAEAIALAQASVAKTAKEPPKGKEVQAAKDYLTGAFVLGLDSTDNLAAYLILMQEETLGIDYLDKRNGYIEAVSDADVARVAKRVLDPSRLIMTAVGNPSEAKDKPSIFDKVE